MEGTVERASRDWPLPNKIPACDTVLHHIQNAPCCDNSHKNVLRCSSVANPKFFRGLNILKLREQLYLVLVHRIWKHKTTR